MMTGLFSLAAVSITGLMVLLPVQLAAGSAKPLLGQCKKLGDGVAGQDAGGKVGRCAHADSVERVSSAAEVPALCAAWV